MKVRKDMLEYNWARTQKQDMILVTNALIHSHFFAVELLLLSPAVYVFFSFFGVGVVGIIQAIKRFFQELDGYVMGLNVGDKASSRGNTRSPGTC